MGLCVLFSLSMFPIYGVYAADQLINGREEGNTEVEGNGDLGVGIDLQGQEEANSGNSENSSSGISSSSSTASTKPSTNDVGKGLNDKVSQNAKTGDVLSGRNIVIMFLAGGALLAIVGFKKKKETGVGAE